MNKTIAEEVIIALLLLIITITFYVGLGQRRHIVYSDPVPPLHLETPRSIPTIDVFTAPPLSNTSNVVGFFAYGAFVTELPLWLSEHWTDRANIDGTMTLSPRVEIPDRDFSDIVIATADTTELNNAEYLFEDNKAHARGEGKLINSEIILNEANNMRIYHLERSLMGIIYSKYYIDGNGKTAEITFSADEASYFKYSTKIKEFIRGLSAQNEVRG